MTRRLKLSLDRPLRGLRPAPATATGSGPGADGSEWIFDLRERARGEARRQEAFEACMNSLRQEVGSLAATVHRRLEEVASLASELGMALAREVLGAACEQGLVDPAATVARCLREVVGMPDGATEVFLAPDDLAVVVDGLRSDPGLADLEGRARFTADPDVERGTVRVETAAGRLLYEPREVLQRICEELRREMSG